MQTRYLRPLLTALSLAAFAAAGALFTGCFNVDPPTGTLDECVKNGGLCLPVGQCAPSGGKLRGGCFFGQGEAECCEGPSPEPEANDCTGQGGLCVELADCHPTRGYVPLHGADCGGGPGRGCCLPHSICGDFFFVCCTVLAERYDPVCDHGEFICPQNTQPVMPSQCKLPDETPGAD